MEKGKLIVIEGTDCSGKETQTKRLVEILEKENFKVKRYSFPMYDTPTGKIVGGPYLGKSYICEGWFNETAPNVDPKVSALYYAADRLYNISKINNDLNNGINVILDRYTYSNMAHQGGKIESNNERLHMYDWLYELEFKLLNLPIPDIKLFIHMPYEGAVILKENREEVSDQNEANEEHLKHAERAYIEIANRFDFETIECVKDSTKEITKDNIRTIEDINKDIVNYVFQKLNHVKDLKDN